VLSQAATFLTQSPGAAAALLRKTHELFLFCSAQFEF